MPRGCGFGCGCSGSLLFDVEGVQCLQQMT
jgi:hypothetical protein